VNGVGELHSTTLEVTMDSFFSGVQLHFTIDRDFYYLVEKGGCREIDNLKQGSIELLNRKGD